MCSMNITLSADEAVIERAREWARSHGTSLNAVIRDHLENLSGADSRPDLVAEFQKNALTGRSDPGFRFGRDDLYVGRRFGG